MQETWFQPLCWEDHLEKGMATHSSNLTPGESHGQRSLAGYSLWGLKELDTTKATEQSIELFSKFCQEPVQVSNIHIHSWKFLSFN